jgi:4-diphosphocytidyl-2-C-methyl-D-erythritol kinase
LRYEIKIPAKINFWLEVISRREDGYHELSSLMLPITLYDHLDLCLQTRSGISLECEPSDVSAGPGNLVWKAAELYLSTGALKSGVDIRLRKKIPVGAGLGGGSADAAATLLGLNAFAERPLNSARLHDLAGQLGADVAFFLYARPALATGIGEKLQHIDGLPPYPLVLIKPPVAVSTQEVYQSLKLTRGKSHINVDRLMSWPWALSDMLVNDLEVVTVAKLPMIAQIKQWLLEQGAVGAIMSGSGPTVFGVFGQNGMAEEVALLAKRVWTQCWVMAGESLCASTL